MKDRILEIIPDRNDIERTLKLAEEYGAVFEYNDFMVPPQTEDADKRRETVAFYRSLGRDLSQDTLHGAFLDITVHSQDPWIRRVSGKRIYQSMETAEELGVRGVVFHTGLLRDYREKSYLENWLETNAAFWEKVLEDFPGRDHDSLFVQRGHLLCTCIRRGGCTPYLIRFIRVAACMVQRLQDNSIRLRPFRGHGYLHSRDRGRQRRKDHHPFRDRDTSGILA